ncbi:MAG: hypothetical protein ACE5OR_01875 [bacterium]
MEKEISLGERLARLEGVMEENSKRLDDFSKRLDDLRDDFNHRISDLRWNMNIWFIILTLLIVIFKFLKL